MKLAPNRTEDESLDSITVTAVQDKSVAQRERLNIGDEIMLVNDTSITELGWSQLEDLLHSATTLSLTIRTCFMDQPLSSNTAAQMMDSLICPAPPPSGHPELSVDMLKLLTVPNPDCEKSTFTTFLLQ